MVKIGNGFGFAGHARACRCVHMHLILPPRCRCYGVGWLRKSGVSCRVFVLRSRTGVVFCGLFSVFDAVVDLAVLLFRMQCRIWVQVTVTSPVCVIPCDFILRNGCYFRSVSASYTARTWAAARYIDELTAEPKPAARRKDFYPYNQVCPPNV